MFVCLLHFTDLLRCAFHMKRACVQTVQLVHDLLAELPEGVGATFTVVCPDLDTADLASQRLPNPVAVTDPAESGVTKGPLLIVNSKNDQVRVTPLASTDVPRF